MCTAGEGAEVQTQRNFRCIAGEGSEVQTLRGISAA
jgi:hypothetical protein